MGSLMSYTLVLNNCSYKLYANIYEVHPFKYLCKKVELQFVEQKGSNSTFQKESKRLRGLGKKCHEGKEINESQMDDVEKTKGKKVEFSKKFF